MSWLEEHQTLLAVRVQELYDTRLFKLPWNTALAGREPAPEDVAAAAARIRDDSRYRDWYSIDLGDTPWPGDVLLCQRMSMIWSRRDHRAYGTTILITGIAWFLLGLAIALARDLSLADYLIKIFLPSSPGPTGLHRTGPLPLAARHQTRKRRTRHPGHLGRPPRRPRRDRPRRLPQHPGHVIPATPPRATRTRTSSTSSAASHTGGDISRSGSPRSGPGDGD